MRMEKGVFMRKFILWFVVFAMFFVGTGCVLTVDQICQETTGQGGNLVFDVEK